MSNKYNKLLFEEVHNCECYKATIKTLTNFEKIKLLIILLDFFWKISIIFDKLETYPQKNINS